MMRTLFDLVDEGDDRGRRARRVAASVGGFHEKVATVASENDQIRRRASSYDEVEQWFESESGLAGMYVLKDFPDVVVDAAAEQGVWVMEAFLTTLAEQAPLSTPKEFWSNLRQTLTREEAFGYVTGDVRTSFTGSSKTAALFANVTEAQIDKLLGMFSQIGYSVDRDEAHDIILCNGGWEKLLFKVGVRADKYEDVNAAGGINVDGNEFAISALYEAGSAEQWAEGDWKTGKRTRSELEQLVSKLRSERYKKSANRMLANEDFMPGGKYDGLYFVNASASAREAALDVNDPFSWGEYLARQAGDASVNRLSGTDLLKILDAGHGSEEVRSWARSLAEKAGTSSVNRLSGSDLLEVLGLPKSASKSASRKVAYFTFDYNDVERGYRAAQQGSVRYPGESYEWLVGYDAAEEGRDLQSALSEVEEAYDSEEAMYGRGGDNDGWGPTTINASRKTAGSAYDVMMGQAGPGSGIVSYKGRKDQFWTTTHFSDASDLEAILSGKAMDLDLSDLYPDEPDLSDVLVFRFPADGGNSDAYVWQGSLADSLTLMQFSGSRKTAVRQRAARGFPCGIPEIGRDAIAMVRRMERGNATAQDLIRCMTDNYSRGVGDQWGLEHSEFGPDWEDQGAEDYAYVNDDTIVRAWIDEQVVGGWSATDQEIWEELGDNLGEVQVILVGEVDAEYINGDWDAAIGQGKKIDLIEIRYNAGWGWKKIPARGMSVTASRKTAGVTWKTSARQPTRADAEKVLKAIEKQVGSFSAYGSEPTIVEDWAWSGSPAPFAILWEEGPYEWTYLFPYGGVDQEFGFRRNDVSGSIPNGIFCEPITSWALGIYEGWDTTASKQAAAKYEIIDTHYPNARGMRFNSLDRAQRELARAVGENGRFVLIDRETNEELGRSGGAGV